jgi:hypothetical protein
MYRKHPETYLAGLDLTPVRETLVGQFAAKVYARKPDQKLIGGIAEAYQLQEPIDPNKITTLLERIKRVELWAVFYTVQPLLHQTNETVLVASFSSPWHQADATIIYQRKDIIDPDLDSTISTAYPDERKFMPPFNN